MFSPSERSQFISHQRWTHTLCPPDLLNKPFTPPLLSLPFTPISRQTVVISLPEERTQLNVLTTLPPCSFSSFLPFSSVSSSLSPALTSFTSRGTDAVMRGVWISWTSLWGFTLLSSSFSPGSRVHYYVFSSLFCNSLFVSLSLSC